MVASFEEISEAFDGAEPIGFAVACQSKSIFCVASAAPGVEEVFFFDEFKEASVLVSFDDEDVIIGEAVVGRVKVDELHEFWGLRHPFIRLVGAVELPGARFYKRHHPGFGSVGDFPDFAVLNLLQFLKHGFYEEGLYLSTVYSVG